MPPRSLRRLLPAAALAGTLLLPVLPATARALPLTGPDGPASVHRAASRDAGGLFNWLGRTIASLWTGDSPAGGSPGTIGTISPDPLDGGPEGDTGPLIDPDG
ncbi:MAG TPA: hypothetical protein VL025_07655 [Thermoanaerobaculia bacterium]|nr:hypothetical protein [Thermoanaerobaculia bacterium]